MWFELNDMPSVMGQLVDNDNGIGNLIPLVVIMVLYGLSSLLKGKKKEPPPSPPRKPVRRQTPLPYARPKAQSKETGPAPTVKPRPVAERPLREEAAKPRAPQPIGQRPAAGPRMVPDKRKEEELRRKHIAQMRTARREQVEGVPRERAGTGQAALGRRVPSGGYPPAAKPKVSTIAEKAARVQMLSTAEAGELRRAGAAKMAVPPTRPVQPLQLLLQQPSDLAKAFVYTEIIGKPVGMRENRPAGF